MMLNSAGTEMKSVHFAGNEGKRAEGKNKCWEVSNHLY